MSGEKRSPIQILQDDLHNTRRQITDVKRMNNKLQSAIKVANEQRQQQATYFEKQLNQRENAFNATVSNMKSSMKQMESNHLSAIKRQNENFNAKIAAERNERQQNIKDLYNYTRESIESTRREFQEITNEQQKEINQVKSDVQQIFATQISNKNAAIEFINDFEQQLKTFNEQMPHQKFVPGGFDKVNEKLISAKSKVENMEQTAFGLAETAYYEFVDLREEVIRKEREFNIWHELTLEATTALFEDIRANHKIELEDNAGEIEANEWTNGKFLELENKVAAIKTSLENNRADLTLTKVQEHFEAIKRLNEEEQELIKEAIERVISSSKRHEIAMKISETLHEYGFIPLSAGYEKGDFKNMYLAKLKRRDGTEIVVSMIPDDATNTNTLSLNTKQPGFLNGVETLERYKAIAKVLRDQGLLVGEMEGKANHIEEFYDVENLVKENSAGLPKSVLEKAKLLNSQTTKDRK